MNRNMLSPEERGEYDQMVYAAGYDALGKKRKSREIGPKMAELLADAVQAGRTWAAWVVADDQMRGHLSRFKQWDRARQIVQTKHGGAVVRRSAVMALQRQDPESGVKFWQDTFWPDMTRDDLLAVIAGSRVREVSEAITQGTARKLLGLLDETGASVVSEGLAVRGMSLDEFLVSDAA